MESKAVGFVTLLKAYGFGLRIIELFTGGKLSLQECENFIFACQNKILTLLFATKMGDERKS